MDNNNQHLSNDDLTLIMEIELETLELQEKAKKDN